jgi:hypothetical protein
MVARMGRGDAATGRAGGPAGEGSPVGGPSEAEMQAILLEMREAPVEQVLAEVVNVLFQTIQVKLGLADARILIDVVAGLAGATSGRVDPQLHGQISQALSQLRLAQVEEERRQGTTPDPVAAHGASAGNAAPAAGPGSDAQTAAHPGAPEGGNAASRLWVPGR